MTNHPDHDRSEEEIGVLVKRVKGARYTAAGAAAVAQKALDRIRQTVSEFEADDEAGEVPVAVVAAESFEADEAAIAACEAMEILLADFREHRSSGIGEQAVEAARAVADAFEAATLATRMLMELGPDDEDDDEDDE